MTVLASTIFSIGLLISPMILGGAIIDFMKKRDGSRINPITKALRRPPGGTIARQLTSAVIDMTMSLGLLFMAVTYPVVLHLFQSYVLNQPETGFRNLITGLIILCLFIYGVRSLVIERRKLQRLRLGYECELAVGQELDQLMRQGFYVFHDIQADNFNIDHLVVGKNGVFAIETKGRSKKLGTAGKNKADYNVEYENSVLRFPGWQESEPVAQAARNAKWVSDWLSRATGHKVIANPVVILPGWFVKTKSLAQVPVLAAGQIPFYFAKDLAAQFSDQQISQMGFQIDQKAKTLIPGDVAKPMPEGGG